MAEASWLPDPSGRHELRYWDGSSWTDHVSDRGATGADPAGDLAEPKPAAAAVAQSQPRQAVTLPAGAVLQVKSHEQGRNSVVTLYRDRIERVKEKSFGSISRAKQDAEVIPMRSVTSVQAKKDGLVYTKVTAFASGNTIDFRLRHEDAQRFKQAITDLLLAPTPSAAPQAVAPAGPTVGAQLKELAELRDAGVLSEDEFQTQKAKLLG